MANLSQVCKEFFRILPVEQLSHLRVLQAPGPHTWRHGQRLMSTEKAGKTTQILDALCVIVFFSACMPDF